MSSIIEIVCREKLAEAQQMIAVQEQIIEDRNRLLAMFDCPLHGSCVPYAIKEVERLRAELAAALVRAERAEAEVERLHTA